jgi:serine/threonine-protein kinase
MAQAETATRVEVGAVIANTYEIKRLLGRGGMGTVWEAHHARLPGKRVAIKVLHPEVARDQESLARFRREAEIATRIGHPNIVEVHDFNELADGTPYLILEFLEGCDLEDRLRRGPMPIAAVIALTRQISSALRAAHREGVIHRDLKPQNVFLARTTDNAGNETEMAKVLDFGISKIRGSSTVQTQDSTILGTPQYMAPEQATGAHQSVDARTDVFALGAMVYEMLAGRPAFEGQTIPEVVFKVVYEDPRPLAELAGIDPGIARAVHVALSKEQDERFASVEEFVEALSGTGLSVSGPNAPTPITAPVDVGTAATVASGPHTPVPGLPGLEDIGTASTVGSGIDSGRMQQDALGIATGQTQLADLGAHPPAVPAQTAAVERPPSRAGLKIGLALGALLLAGGGAVAAYVIGQQSGGSDPIAAGQIDAAADPVAEVAPIDIAAVDAAAPIAPADASPAPAPDARVAKRTPRPPVRDRPGEGDADVEVTVEPPANAGPDDPRRDLAGARKLIASNPREAIRLVRRAMRNGGRGQQYSAVLVMAHCKLLDLTPANAALRGIRSPTLRRSVKKRCKAFGMDLE